jgi:hypothetical protein
MIPRAPCARGWAIAVLALGGFLAVSQDAWAFDPSEVYRQGALVISGEAGYGAEIHFYDTFTGLEFVNAGVRLGVLPFGTTGPGILQGALEVGLEPIYQRYVSPVGAFYAGLAAVTRYHFTSLGRFVPYVELAGAAGGTDLRVAEQSPSAPWPACPRWYPDTESSWCSPCFSRERWRSTSPRARSGRARTRPA